MGPSLLQEPAQSVRESAIILVGLFFFFCGLKGNIIQLSQNG